MRPDRRLGGDAGDDREEECEDQGAQCDDRGWVEEDSSLCEDDPPMWLWCNITQRSIEDTERTTYVSGLPRGSAIDNWLDRIHAI